MTDKRKTGRPPRPKDEKLRPRSFALSQKEEDFIIKQKPTASGFVRELIKKAMIEAGENVTE